MTQSVPTDIPALISSTTNYAKLFSLDENYANLFSLDENWRTEAPLPPDLFLLSLSYLVEERKEYYPNGNLREYGFFVDGYGHGDWTKWRSNGKVAQIQTYKHGRLHGECKHYYDGQIGQLYSHEFFVEGKLDGKYRDWHLNGQLHGEYFYVKGVLQGVYKRWWDNGNLSYESFHVNGIEKGVWKRFSIDGKLVDNGYYI